MNYLLTPIYKFLKEQLKQTYISLWEILMKKQKVNFHT